MFCHPTTGICDRKNFDSLLWATITVFQVTIVYNTIAGDELGETVLDTDPGGLEPRPLRWDGEDFSLGRSVLRAPHDLWKLRLVQLARGYFG